MNYRVRDRDLQGMNEHLTGVHSDLCLKVQMVKNARKLS